MFWNIEITMKKFFLNNNKNNKKKGYGIGSIKVTDGKKIKRYPVDMTMPISMIPFFRLCKLSQFTVGFRESINE